MNTIQSLKSLTLVVLLFASAPAHSADAPTTPPPGASAAKRIKNVGVEEFARLVESKTNVVLDVRSAREYAAGHIAGAVNIDVKSADFEKKVAQLDKGKTYLVHCAGGVRSAQACEKLDKLNFHSLVNLEPGFKAWEKAGKPVEK